MKLVLTAPLFALAAFAQTHWVGTWGAAPAPQLETAEMEKQKLVFHDQTLREIVHVSIGGDTVRIRLSNAFGRATCRGLVLPTSPFALRAPRSSGAPITPSPSVVARVSKFPPAPSLSVTLLRSRLRPPPSSPSASLSAERHRRRGCPLYRLANQLHRPRRCHRGRVARQPRYRCFLGVPHRRRRSGARWQRLRRHPRFGGSHHHRRFAIHGRC